MTRSVVLFHTAGNSAGTRLLGSTVEVYARGNGGQVGSEDPSTTPLKEKKDQSQEKDRVYTVEIQKTHEAFDPSKSLA